MDELDPTSTPVSQGLYNPANEHDNCGVGFVAHIKGTKSHDIVANGLLILRNLTHRGAVGADPLMGDGAGILIQIPDRFYRDEMASQGVTLPPIGEYGVGMVFLPKESASRLACQEEIERAVRAEGQVLLGWRDVPVDHTMPISPYVKAKEPVIRQIFIGRGRDVMVTDALERKLYIIRKRSGHAIQALRLKYGKEFYVPSMSARTVAYKGMLLAEQVGVYYKDLQDARVVSALALVHQRFSTNTFPTWDLAHPVPFHRPQRRDQHAARQRELDQGAPERDLVSRCSAVTWTRCGRLIYDGQSDSASFDNALELLYMAGYPLAHAVMMMIPEAWEKHTLMDQNRRAFYEYHAATMEPWDGPAAVAFTDGRQIGATLDRNGLQARPLRRHRRRPGDHGLGGRRAAGARIQDRQEVATAARQDVPRRYRCQGASSTTRNSRTRSPTPNRTASGSRVIRIRLDDLRAPDETVQKPPPRLCSIASRPSAIRRRILKFLMQPMAQNGEEPIGSMGNDSPLAVLSNRPKPFYDYFKQLFAQVTNPPIDPIREELVMSLVSFIGPKPNLLDISEHQPADPAGGVAAGAVLRGHGKDPPHREVHQRQVPLL